MKKKTNQRQELERLKRKRDKRRREIEERINAPRITPLGDHILFEHPRNIFRVEVPADWDWFFEDETLCTTFRPESKEASFCCTMMPIHFDMTPLLESPKIEEMCRAMFEKMNAKNPRRDPTIAHFAMKADRNQTEVAGYYWIVIEHDVFLNLSAWFPHGQEDKWWPTFERILTTFRVAREQEGLIARVQMRLVEKLRARFPEEDYKISGGSIVGKTRSVPASNLLVSVKQHPERWQELTDEFAETSIAVAAAFGDNLGQESLDSVRKEIFPFIRPDSLRGREEEEENEGELVLTDWMASLVIGYVIRIAGGFRYITTFDLQRWHIDQDELHALAIENLERLDGKMTLQKPPAGTLPLLFVHTGDSMESSRLLSSNLYGRFSPSLKGNFIAAIPARDALILFPNEPNLRRHVQECVRKDFSESPYAISDRLFLVTKDGVTLAEW